MKAADRVLLGAHSFLAYALTDGDAALRPDHREHDGSPLAGRARRAAAVG